MSYKTDKSIKDITTNRIFKNLIINGDFSVWQRGTSFNTDKSIYTADRFLDWTNSVYRGITSKHISKGFYDGPEFIGNIYRLQIAGIDSNNSNRAFGLTQRVEITSENYHLYLDKTYTVSFWIRTNKSHFTTYVIASDQRKTYIHLLDEIHNAEPNKWTKIIWTYELTKDLFVSKNIDLNSLRFVELFGVIIPDAQVGDYVEFAYIQVEEGEEATEFEHIPYDIQLQRCMRYYEVIENAVAFKAPYEDDTYGYVTFKVKKRAKPSITFIRPSDGVIGGADYYYWSNNNMHRTKTGVYIAASVDKDGVAFGHAKYKPPSINDAHLITNIHADAEL